MNRSHNRVWQYFAWIFVALALLENARGEAMLSLFNLTWVQITQKMPEIAEAGYDSLWVPPPGKAGSGFSVGYDVFDPFDLGEKNQRGTVATRYGTKAELLQMVETAHRFGIRVYFDNIMNHRGFDTPGFNASTPTNIYPGLVPQDFHLKTVSGGFYANWPNIEDFNNQFDVQYESLSGLIDLANEPGSVNGNFGSTLGSTTPKLTFIRQPGNPDYYMDTNGAALGGPWHGFNGTNGQPVAEDVNSYLIRAAMWTLYTTKCDGFRMDAVKHVPSGFFGDSSTSWNGYTGGIQAMFDFVHGFGTNVIGNGYFEPDDSRNSCFDSEAPRNDALLFGEHLGAPPTFSEYLARGMRLLNTPLVNQMNNVLGNPSASLSGMDQRDFTAYAGAFSAAQSVMFAQSHDNGFAVHRDLQNAYYFTHEGIPEIYSDGYNQSQGQNPFPSVANANYLGEFGDNAMPELCYLHNQMSRGGTWPRWSDNDVVIYERYDYREGNGANPQDQDVLLFAMNDNYGFPGDISFDDGVTRTNDGYYGCGPVSNSRGLGIVVGFPPGSVLAQMAQASSGANRACAKLLVHKATQSLTQAQMTGGDATPENRMIYVGGQTLAPNGGAVELLIPSGGYVLYGYQWPEASRSSLKDTISLRQSGADAPRLTVTRQDGTNGDGGFNPIYPFKMRGSVDPLGNVVGGANVSNRTYAIDVPVLTNAPFDIVVRNDASSGNALVKLDGGADINSQMGLGPTNGTDLRDNRPGFATDVFLGYEQTALQFQNGPEKFAARNILSNNIVSAGAETYRYFVGGTNGVALAGTGLGAGITNQTATWVFHDPTNVVTALGTVPPTQLDPMSPGTNQPADVWVKAGYQLQINAGYIYYTTDGTNPEGSFGTGKGTTSVVPVTFVNHDSGTGIIDWWKGTIPGQTNGTEVRYKVGLFNGGLSQPISDAEPSGSKLYGLTQYAITNFNPGTALVWLHDDLNPANTTTGLREGFHIVRARTFLPRAGKSSVYNTFLQTFYYDAQLPVGTIAFPAADGTTISNNSYTVVVRADTTTTGVEYNIADSNTNNDDVVTGQHNGNGTSNGAPVFVQASQVSPDPTLDQQFPDQPLEFRFNYAAIPGSGTATITVHLKKLTTSINTNRVTTLIRTVNTAAPAQIMQISSPTTNGQVLLLKTNDNYTIQVCFTPSLAGNNINFFSIFINGVFQARQASNGAPFYLIGGSACGSSLSTLSYHWSGAMPGTNAILVTLTNNISLSDSRNVIVANPVFDINSITPQSLGGSIVWDSVPGVNYQVWATTNLSIPMAPISGVISASGSSTFFSDPAPDPLHKFYRIELLP